MSEQWHPHNGQLAPVLGVSSVLEEWLAVSPRASLLATDDLRRWQLGSLLAHPQARVVGATGELLLPLLRGLIGAGNQGAIIAPTDQILGTLPPGSLAIAVADTGFGASAARADYAFCPADVHQATAAVRWALSAVEKGESVLINVSGEPVPLVWSPNTKFDPDRWVAVGSGDTLVLAFGSAMATVRAAVESDKVKARCFNLVDCAGDLAARQAIRALTVGCSRVIVVRAPGCGEWLVESLSTIKKTYQDIVLKPDWRGHLDYGDGEQIKTVKRALKKTA